MTKEGVEDTSGEEEQKFVIGLEKEDPLIRARWRKGVGERELERLLLEWGKSSHPHLRG